MMIVAPIIVSPVFLSLTKPEMACANTEKELNNKIDVMNSDFIFEKKDPPFHGGKEKRSLSFN